MTSDAKSMLDIVRRIATHLKEEQQPGRRVIAEKHRASGQPPSCQVAGAASIGEANNHAGTTGASKHGKGERGFTLAEMLISRCWSPDLPR